MSKYIGVAVALAVVGFTFLNINPYKIAENKPRSAGLTLPGISFTLPKLSLPGINQAAADPAIGVRAFAVFSQYLEFARTHNLEGLSSLSYQLSAACKDPAQETECFRLMDSVYFFASDLRREDFKHVKADGKQAILYTDGPAVKLLYFTRDDSGNFKVLGLRFCEERSETSEPTCIELNADTRDSDNDGWWNSTEELFK
jgi:hypothetical protein